MFSGESTAPRCICRVVRVKERVDAEVTVRPSVSRRVIGSAANWYFHGMRAAAIFTRN